MDSGIPAAVKTAFLEQRRDQFVAIFKGLWQDAYSIVRRVLEVCWSGIWADVKVKRTVKINIFAENTMSQASEFIFFASKSSVNLGMSRSLDYMSVMRQKAKVLRAILRTWRIISYLQYVHAPGRAYAFRIRAGIRATTKMTKVKTLPTMSLAEITGVSTTRS